MVKKAAPQVTSVPVTTAHRLTLLAICSAVAPALATGKIETPVLGSLCFGDGTVYTFDELIAMECNLPNFPVRGAIHGPTMINWIDKASGKEIEVRSDGTIMTLKCGRSEFTFPLAPTETFLFDRPDMTKAPKFTFTESMKEALKASAASMDTKGEHAWRLGITCVFGEKGITLYTCDNLTATRAKAKVPFDAALSGKAVIFPPRFLDTLNRAKEGQEFFVGEDWISTKNDGVTVYCNRRGFAASTEMYKELFSDVEANVKKAILLPQTWRKMYERALVTLVGSKEPASRWIVGDGRMTIETESPLGRSRDVVKLAGPHDSFQARVQPHAILQAPEGAESFNVLPVGGGFKLTLVGKGFVFIASLLGVE